MIYNKFQDISLSALGMGCMRLPLKENGNTVDKVATSEMVKYAMEHGINYYDTAYGYHDGASELVMGEILKEYPRDSFYLATKFPGYDPNNWEYVAEIFEEQLKKLQVDYFDFYLFHNVCEKNLDAYLDPKYGIYDYLVEQKKNGRIKHLGFSAHAEMEGIKRFLHAYGKDMEFCQIELNYYDWSFQDAKAKVELLNQWNIPIWVMEPVRGGQLVNLSPEAEAKLKAERPDEEVVAWAFRFLQGIPNVTMTLSGMSNYQQMADNIATYETNNPLTAEETATILAIADDMIKSIAVPCTSCRYCTTKCPMELNIPSLIKLFNEGAAGGPGSMFLVGMRMSAMEDKEHPKNCIGCQSCEVVCPQEIKISKVMKKLNEQDFQL